MQYIVADGDVEQGFRFVGPFGSRQAAESYVNKIYDPDLDDTEPAIIELHVPHKR